MKSLRQVIGEAQQAKTAVAHFNISELGTLKAIFSAGQELSTPAKHIPIIIGVSEGERDFIGLAQAVALVKSLRDQYDYPIFINADHTHSVEKAKAAIDAGFDAVIIDGGALPLAQNIAMTKEVVAYARGRAYEVLIEGELGYIGSGSEVLKEVPKGAAITIDSITKVSEAQEFVTATGVDLLAPAVGNIHGMFAGAPNPHLFIDRVKEISEAVKLPLVLHGGSGTPDEDFMKSVDAGVAIIHISTELRRAWRAGEEKALHDKPDEVAPYKLLEPAVAEVAKVALARLKLFNRL